MAARLASLTSARQTSGPMKGSNSSPQSTVSPSSPPTKQKLESTPNRNTEANASATAFGEVRAEAEPSSGGKHCRAPGDGPPAWGGAPTRMMTWCKARFADRVRTVEVNSSSRSSHDVPLPLPKKESILKPPFEAWAPTWLRSTTFLSSSGALAKTALSPALTTSRDSAVSSEGSGQIIMASQPWRRSSTSSKRSFPTSRKSTQIGAFEASSDSFACTASLGPAPAKPQMATLPMLLTL
mmetsp:Transcript_52372/g.132362  ORF Transcript_52372/g.132362 Transcript_52372/m.132362 type:complete len:239 (-) Transcript_52372:591-1307(-)